jgi:hypothetical protein
LTVRRWVAAGGVIGVVIALAFTLAMPTRYVKTVSVPAPHGKRVPVYGALQPFAPRSLSVVKLEKSPRIVRDTLLGLIAGGLVALTITTVAPGTSRRKV